MMRKWQLVFHIDQVNTWALVLGNVHNFLADIAAEDEAAIAVVANGSAVTVWRDGQAEIRQGIQDAAHGGAVFYFCRNALRGNDIKEESLPDYVQTVSAGITKIVDLQEQGYAYIKP